MSEKKGILTFEKDSRHFTSLINGAYGGVVGDGMGDLVEVHFFCETNPEIEKIEVDLTTGKELARYPSEVSKKREVKFTALMTVRTAQSVAEWLLKNVSDAKRAHTPPESSSSSGKIH